VGEFYIRGRIIELIGREASGEGDERGEDE
jgi:hypothetical protein